VKIGEKWRQFLVRVVLKTMILSFLRMQESPVYAVYEIPAYAGTTRKLTFSNVSYMTNIYFKYCKFIWIFMNVEIKINNHNIFKELLK